MVFLKIPFFFFLQLSACELYDGDFRKNKIVDNKRICRYELSIESSPMREEEPEDMCQPDDPHFLPFVFRHAIDMVRRGDLANLKQLQMVIPENAFFILLNTPMFNYTKSLETEIDLEQSYGNVLHLACGKFDNEMIKFLLKVGMDTYMLASDNSLPLQVLFQVNPDDRANTEEMCLLMLEEDGDLILENVEIDDGVQVPLIHMASFYNFQELLKYLIKNGADVDCESVMGPPIALACKGESLEALEILIENGASVDYPCDASENSCLFHSMTAEYCNEKIVENLFKCHPHRCFKSGWMISHFAAKTGDAELLRDIFDNFQHSIPIYATAKDGSNVLHIACQFQQYEVVKLLVEKYKMDSQIKNKKGQTAQKIAMNAGRKRKILQLLL